MYGTLQDVVGRNNRKICINIVSNTVRILFSSKGREADEMLRNHIATNHRKKYRESFEREGFRNSFEINHKEHYDELVLGCPYCFWHTKKFRVPILVEEVDFT